MTDLMTMLSSVQSETYLFYLIPFIISAVAYHIGSRVSLGNGMILACLSSFITSVLFYDFIGYNGILLSIIMTIFCLVIYFFIAHKRW